MSLTEQEHGNLVAMVTKEGKKAWFIERTHIVLNSAAAEISQG